MRKFVLIPLVFLVCGGNDVIQESSPTITDAEINSTTSTSTTTYDAELAWDNFLEAWENNLKTELILSSSEMAMTEELNKLWTWQGDKYNLNQYLFEIEVNGFICTRIYNSMG